MTMKRLVLCIGFAWILFFFCSLYGMTIPVDDMHGEIAYGSVELLSLPDREKYMAEDTYVLDCPEEKFYDKIAYLFGKEGWTDVTESMAREPRVEQVDSHMEKIQYYVVYGLLGGMAILVVLFGGLCRMLKVIRRENRKLLEFIIELDNRHKNSVDVKDGIEQNLPVNPDPSVMLLDEASKEGEDTDKADENLFLQFDRQVKEQKLYLNYQWGRDDYARLMGVDRNRFAILLKKFTAKNLNAYLNELRLEYSVILFQEHPDWSINKVAEESALPRISTFYRLFKERYGISPNIFRNTLM